MTEKEWLVDKMYYYDIDENKLKSIFYFSLIWNLFEKKLCGTKALIATHPKKIARRKSENIDLELVEEIYSYFQKRYVNSRGATKTFKDFKFADKVFKDFVLNGFLKQELPKTDKVQSLLYIAFRLRNNLYHGIKDVSKLYEQNNNFRQINKLLMALLNSAK